MHALEEFCFVLKLCNSIVMFLHAMKIIRALKTFLWAGIV